MNGWGYINFKLTRVEELGFYIITRLLRLQTSKLETQTFNASNRFNNGGCE
jgi:hypothetical protein